MLTDINTGNSLYLQLNFQLYSVFRFVIKVTTENVTNSANKPLFSILSDQPVSWLAGV